MTSGDIPHFPVTVTQPTIDQHVKTFLTSLFSTTLEKLKEVKRVDLGAGLTNIIVGYDISNLLDQQPCPPSTHIFLAKIYGHGTELLIDRNQEIASFRELSRHGVAPPLYCTFTNGFCYKYIGGTQCTVDQFQHWDIVKLSAQCLARFHSVVLSDEYIREYTLEPVLFLHLNTYLKLLKQHSTTPTTTTTTTTTTRAPQVPSVETLEAEVAQLREMLPNACAVVFCHNDLNLPNLIHDPNTATLHCIDYEYAAPNYLAYDIANHFQEFAGNNDTPNFNLLPDRETQCKWLRVYLSTRAQACGDVVVSDGEVNKLFVQVVYFSLFSHLMWGIWALVQGSLSHIDFDYVGYAGQRFEQYFLCKPGVMEILSAEVLN